MEPGPVFAVAVVFAVVVAVVFVFAVAVVFAVVFAVAVVFAAVFAVGPWASHEWPLAIGSKVGDAS